MHLICSEVLYNAYPLSERIALQQKKNCLHNMFEEEMFAQL